jgi:hypothetical protein
MGSFAEMLSEAARREVDDTRAASPFADAVRAFEDRVAIATYAAVSGWGSEKRSRGHQTASRYAAASGRRKPPVAHGLSGDC